MRVIAVFTLVCSMFLYAQTVRAAENDDIRKFVSDYYDAWNTLKSANAARFYAKDADIVFFDVAPMQYHGWSEYQEGAQKNFFDAISTCKLTPNNDLKIGRRGDVAWITLTFHIAATTKKGEESNLDCRQTSILEKRAGGWQIVHEHISAPLPVSAE